MTCDGRGARAQWGESSSYTGEWAEGRRDGQGEYCTEIG
jgi:hypothetical protein